MTRGAAVACPASAPGAHARAIAASAAAIMLFRMALFPRLPRAGARDAVADDGHIPAARRGKRAFRAIVSQAAAATSESVPDADARAIVSAWPGDSSSVAVLPTTDLLVLLLAECLIHGEHAHIVEDRAGRKFCCEPAVLRVSRTSTRSFGRMKPPAPDSTLMPIDTARMPGDSWAAMKPALSACTILVVLRRLASGQRRARHRAVDNLGDIRRAGGGDEARDRPRISATPASAPTPASAWRPAGYWRRRREPGRC